MKRAGQLTWSCSRSNALGRSRSYSALTFFHTQMKRNIGHSKWPFNEDTLV